MRCPKCGTENPDDVQICSTCGYVPKSDAAEKPIAKPKTSRLAIASLLLSIFGLFTFLITALISIALGITSLCRIKKHKDELKGKCIAVTGITISLACILVFLAAFVLWSLDAPPIPNDYTIANLSSAPPECNRSYELLMSLSDKKEPPTVLGKTDFPDVDQIDVGQILDVNGNVDPDIIYELMKPMIEEAREYQPDAPKIGLSAQDVNTIDYINEVIKEGDFSKITEVLEANADNIEQAWKNGQKGRDIISELNTFPEIADLTEPNLAAEVGFLPNLRRLARLYEAYVYLQTEQGNDKVAINELIKLDSVFRKLSVNARSIVTKMLCISGLYTGIRAANFIINNPKTPQESLELLEEHFTSLTNEQIALRSSFISDYLMAKNALEALLPIVIQTSPLLLKRNSTLRALRSACDFAIYYAGEAKENEKHEWSIWPSFYPDSMPTARDLLDEPSCWQYKYYNPSGYWFIGIITPALGRIAELKMKIKVHDDLLQIVLNKRLGKEINLKARAYSDEYIIDTEKKIIFSPGPDGEPDTKDDIKRVINPEVLNLTD